MAGGVEPSPASAAPHVGTSDFIEYFNNLNALDEKSCLPRCTGQSSCGQLPDMEQCLDPELDQTCQWTCD